LYRVCGAKSTIEIALVPVSSDDTSKNSLYIRAGLRYSQGVIRFIFVIEAAINWQLAASKNSNSQLAK
jgi:hypothetical protein